MDIVTANSCKDTLTVMYGQGDGTFPTAATYPVGQTPSTVVISDFNRDGKPDFATTNETSKDVSVLVRQGDGSLLKTDYPVTGSPHSVAAADFDGDGNSDLAIAIPSNNNLMILFGSGTGTFPRSLNIAVPNPYAVIAADLNGDKAPDLVVTDSANVNARVFLNTNQANLSVTMTSSQASVSINENYTYQVTVTNQGPNMAYNPVFTNSLPADFAFSSLIVPADTVQGWPGPICKSPAKGAVGGAISCTDIFLAIGDSFTLSVTVTSPKVGAFANSATVTNDTPDAGLLNHATLAVTIKGICGNNIVEAGEDCEGTNLNGADCVSQGFASGTLSCTSCQFDKTACLNVDTTNTGGTGSTGAGGDSGGSTGATSGSGGCSLVVPIK